MGEGMWHRLAPGVALERVVTDLARRVQGLLQVAGFDRAKDRLGLMRPDSGQAVGLQFDTHRNRVRIGLTGTLARRIRLPEDAQFVLNVMGDLVRDDIGRGKVAARTKLTRQRDEEVRIKVDLPVDRTVKGPVAAEAVAQGDCVMPLNSTSVGGEYASPSSARKMRPQISSVSASVTDTNSAAWRSASVSSVVDWTVPPPCWRDSSSRTGLTSTPRK